MDMFLPAVPVIARALATDAGPGAAQVTVTTYLAGLALGQLAWGPVSDRFGRKPVLLCGLGLALCAAAWGALATSIGELALVRNAQFRAALATMVCAQMGIIAFVSSSSIAMVQSMGLSPAQFGGLFSLVMLGQISGGIAASRLVSRLGVARMVRGGAGIALAGGVLLAALSLGGSLHWSAVVLPMLLYIFGCALLIPSGIATALAPFPQMAGSASSLLGAQPFALGALVSAALAGAYDGSTRPMALAIGLSGALAFLAERLYFRRLVHG